MHAVIVRYVIVLVLGIMGGSYFTAKVSETELAETRESHAVALAAAKVEEARKTANAQKELRETQQEIARLDTKNHGQLEAQRNEIERLNACLRTGTCGLRVNATCPATGSGDGNADPAAARVDDGKGPALTPVAESAYFALRHGINENEAKLIMCQEYAGALWNRVNKLQGGK